MSVDRIDKLQDEIHDIALKVAKGEEAHDNLKDLLEGHIKNSEKWRESTDAQIHAIANALLQEQARDEVVLEHKSKQSRRQSELTNRQYLLYTTVFLGACAVLSNLDGLFELCRKFFGLF